VAYSDAGDFREAMRAYKKAIEITPDQPDAYFNLGNLYGRAGMAGEAIAYYRQALQRGPKSLGLTYRKIGDAYEVLGEHDKALTNYQLALFHYRLVEAAGHELARVHVAIGLLYKGTGRNEEAIEAYRQALLVKPDLAEALSNLGVIYEELGRTAEAEECYRRSVARKPNLAEPYNNLGLLYLGQHREEEAVALLRKAVALSPRQPVPTNNLGLAYLALGQYEPALAAFQLALKSDSGFAPALAGLARTYRRMGRDDLAVVYAAKATALGYNGLPEAMGDAASGRLERP
jgi:tetratricopeptide (TPR) repeat protein